MRKKKRATYIETQSGHYTKRRKGWRETTENETKE